MRKLLFGLVVLAGVAYTATALTLDFDGHTLGRSLAGETGASHYLFDCTEERRGRWSCDLYDGGDSTATYLVRRASGKCWQARRGRPSSRGPAFPATAAGCVDALEAMGDAFGAGPDKYD